ncbi:hypothetical protein COU18_00725 [Candidatus Kaiserbacteria bacterium CG10_big_fil_rev_8_21_14_0_10_51_14]|uniref:Uncharacterized protein n=1 Tax=Candidatus Kaiserbacteria bacterium CG10_big_fil_rev_8_21_14_0_10_51_14 TaxID=1974610 RepID=A0A2H0UBX2_9BACT|nr:MAG: hypothetical protein COU18_00725 [Candidatus Kaiserbacteria bacterium CG10_big_fil_rev_8_21_14_0_10_51_14]
MSNFHPKLEDATDDQLRYMVNELDFRVVPLASDELTRRAITKLGSAITGFNAQSSKQTEKMIALTNKTIILTVAMLLLVVAQVWLASRQTKYAEIQSIPEQINQAQQIQYAIAFCEENPTSKESGIFEISTGNPASCDQILRKYRPPDPTSFLRKILPALQINSASTTLSAQEN